jgi:signal transduction histidine kinase
MAQSRADSTPRDSAKGSQFPSAAAEPQAPSRPILATWLSNGRALTVLVSGAVLLSVAAQRLVSIARPRASKAESVPRTSRPRTPRPAAVSPPSALPLGLTAPASDASRGLSFRTWPLLTVAFSSLVLLIVLSGLAAQRKAREIYTDVVRINEAYHVGEQRLQAVRDGVHVSSVLLRDYLLDPSLERAPAYRSELLRLRDLTSGQLGELGKLGAQLGPDANPKLQQLRTEVDAYWESLDPVFEWTPDEKRAMSSSFLRRQVMPRRDAALSLAREIASFHDRTLANQRRQMVEHERQYSSFLVRMVAISALLGVAVAFASIFRVSTLERRSAEQRRRTEHAEQQLRLLSYEIVHAQEDERRLISRELHDEVGQMLTGLRIELRQLGETHYRPRTQFDARLQEVRRSLERTIQSVRDIAMGLRPSMLDDLGLGPALEWQAREFARQHDIPVTVDIRARLDGLSDMQRTGIYRIAQEALTNCARHAHARSVRIELVEENDRLSLVVQDDGVGMPAGGAGAASMGLLGMAERARELGGEMSIHSAPEQGTRVRVDLPFDRGGGMRAESTGSADDHAPARSPSAVAGRAHHA